MHKGLRLAARPFAWAIAVLVLHLATPTSGHGPGDSLASFQEVHRLLQRGAFVEAVELLEHVEDEHPYDDVIAQALHWRVFALWRIGDVASLRRAVDDLTRLVHEHPDVALRLETEALCPRLARALVEQDDSTRAQLVEDLGARLREHAEARRESD